MAVTISTIVLGSLSRYAPERACASLPPTHLQVPLHPLDILLVVPGIESCILDLPRRWYVNGGILDQLLRFAAPVHRIIAIPAEQVQVALVDGPA